MSWFRTEADRFRTEARELLQGLAAALDRQFERWALSPAEKEVALLLLKGLSHKEKRSSWKTFFCRASGPEDRVSFRIRPVVPAS